MKRCCEGMEELLIEYVDGDLTQADRDAVDAHCSECECCAEELQEIEALKCCLVEDGYVEPSPFYWTRFNARLRKRLHPAGRWAEAAGRWQVLAPKLVPVAVAVVCFGVGLWLGVRPVTEPATVGGQAPAYTEAQYTSDGPLVSPKSKHLVESGLEYASYGTPGGDTLQPQSYDQPRVYLTGDKTPAQQEIEERLEELNE